MAVTIVFFTLAAFYLCALRLQIAVCLRIDSSLHPRFGVALCSASAAKRRAKAERKRRKSGKWKRILQNKALLSACLRALFCLLRRIHFGEICASGRIASPDAARTALLTGMANALEESLRPCLPLCIRLRPDFSSTQSDALICGMFSLRIGHIIEAAAVFAARYLKGGIAQWKNTRSKAS